MKNVKLIRCLTALIVLSLMPVAWSDETAAPDPAAPPATTEISNEGVPPAPVADPGMGSPEEAPPAETASEAPVEKPHKKKKKAARHAKKKKKAAKHGKKKAGAKKKKKKKNHY